MRVKYEPDVFDGFEDIQFCFSSPASSSLSSPACLPSLSLSLSPSLWPLTCGSCVNVLSPHCVGLPLIVSLCCVVATETLDRLQQLRRTHMPAQRSYTQSQSHTRDLKLFVPPHFPHPTRSLFRVLQTHTCAFACLSVSVHTHTHTLPAVS